LVLGSFSADLSVSALRLYHIGETSVSPASLDGHPAALTGRPVGLLAKQELRAGAVD
jgi:hypothetical protein